MDLAGVSMMHFGGVRLKCMNACLRVFEQHYKERLGRAVVINAPAWWGSCTSLTDMRAYVPTASYNIQMEADLAAAATSHP